MHGVHHEVQRRVQELAGLFWIETLDQLGGALEVSKEYSHLFPFAFQGSARRENFLGEIGWCVCQRSALLVADRRRGYRSVPSPD
jgi:hypothetical protein